MMGQTVWEFFLIAKETGQASINYYYLFLDRRDQYYNQIAFADENDDRKQEWADIFEHLRRQGKTFFKVLSKNRTIDRYFGRDDQASDFLFLGQGVASTLAEAKQLAAEQATIFLTSLDITRQSILLRRELRAKTEDNVIDNLIENIRRFTDQTVEVEIKRFADQPKTLYKIATVPKVEHDKPEIIHYKIQDSSINHNEGKKLILEEYIAKYEQSTSRS